MYEKVILPTDGSKLSYLGVREGLRAAKTLGIPAIAIYVIKPTSYSVSFSGPEIGAVEAQELKYLREGFMNQGKKILEKIGEEAEKMGVSMEKKVVEGVPYREITELAGKKDIIYMSSHGHSGLSSVFLGSTTDRVIKHSKATVAVVKANDKE